MVARTKQRKTRKKRVKRHSRGQSSVQSKRQSTRYNKSHNLVGGSLNDDNDSPQLPEMPPPSLCGERSLIPDIQPKVESPQGWSEPWCAEKYDIRYHEIFYDLHITIAAARGKYDFQEDEEVREIIQSVDRVKDAFKVWLEAERGVDPAELVEYYSKLLETIQNIPFITNVIHKMETLSPHEFEHWMRSDPNTIFLIARHSFNPDLSPPPSLARRSPLVPQFQPSPCPPAGNPATRRLMLQQQSRRITGAHAAGAASLPAPSPALLPVDLDDVVELIGDEIQFREKEWVRVGLPGWKEDESLHGFVPSSFLSDIPGPDSDLGEDLLRLTHPGQAIDSWQKVIDREAYMWIDKLCFQPLICGANHGREKIRSFAFITIKGIEEMIRWRKTDAEAAVVALWAAEQAEQEATSQASRSRCPPRKRQRPPSRFQGDGRGSQRRKAEGD